MPDPLLPGTQYFPTGSVLQPNAAFTGYNVRVGFQLNNVPAPQAGVTFWCLYQIQEATGLTVFQGGFPVGNTQNMSFPWFNNQQATVSLTYLAKWLDLNGQPQTQTSPVYSANYTPNVAGVVAPTLPTPLAGGITSGAAALVPPTS